MSLFLTTVFSLFVGRGIALQVAVISEACRCSSCLRRRCTHKSGDGRNMHTHAHALLENAYLTHTDALPIKYNNNNNNNNDRAIVFVVIVFYNRARRSAIVASRRRRSTSVRRPLGRRRRVGPAGQLLLLPRRRYGNNIIIITAAAAARARAQRRFTRHIILSAATVFFFFFVAPPPTGRPRTTGNSGRSVQPAAASVHRVRQHARAPPTLRLFPLLSARSNRRVMISTVRRQHHLHDDSPSLRRQ